MSLFESRVGKVYRKAGRIGSVLQNPQSNTTFKKNEHRVHNRQDACSTLIC